MFPSIFHLYQQDNLDEHIAIIGIGRRDITNDDFRNQVKSSIQKHVKRYKQNSARLWNMSSIIDMMLVMKKAMIRFSNESDHQFELKGNRLFYLAMAPQFFGVISDYLKSSGLTDTKGFKRLVIEKPFGSDLKSAT